MTIEYPRHTVLYDEDGNPIESTLDSAGDYHLGVATIQSVYSSTLNKTSTNLGAGLSWEGSSETTLGVAGIQVNFFSDQNCTIKCHQSGDGTHFDQVDTWRVFAGQGDSRTFQATGQNFYISVTNEGTVSTTGLRVDTALCPIVEAVPRALSQGGGMFTTPIDGQNKAWQGKVTADGDLKTTGLGAPTITVRFAENFFDSYTLYDKQEGGGTRDTNLGQCSLSTISSVSSSALWSKNCAYLSIQKLSTVLFTLSFDQPTLNNNTRVWGLMTSDRLSGIVFELLNGVLYASAYFNGVATRTNIDYYKPTDGVMHRFKIQCTGSEALFFIDDNYICQIVSLLAVDHPIVSNSFLPVMVDNSNTASSSPCSIHIAGLAYYLSTATQNVITDPYEMTPVRVSKSGRLDVLPTPSIRFLAQFYENSFDTSRTWLEVIAGSASRTVLKNMLTLHVTTGATDSITETTKNAIVPQTQTEVQRVASFMNLGGFTDPNNRREWGAKYQNDGNFFRCDGGEMYAVVLSNGTELIQDLGPCGPLLDDKFHKYSVRRIGQVYTWFYIDDAQVAFFCASANQPLTYRVDDHPYLANYNTGVTAVPLVLNCLGVYVADEASSTTAIQGADINGDLHNVTVDSQGRMTPAPFIPIQVGVTYLTNQQVNTITETDQFGAVLTTTVGYNANKRVTSIGQVLVE